MDGLATSIAAWAAVLLEPAVVAYPVAGQRSRERAHAPVLERLGLEPVLDLRLRVGEGVGAALACNVLLSALRVRRETGRTANDQVHAGTVRGAVAARRSRTGCRELLNLVLGQLPALPHQSQRLLGNCLERQRRWQCLGMVPQPRPL